MFFSRKKKSQAQARETEGRYMDHVQRQAEKEARRAAMEAERVGHKPLDNPTYSALERKQMAAVEREDITAYFKRAQGMYGNYRITMFLRMGTGDVRELEVVDEVSTALIQAVQDRLGVFLEGRARTASGAVTDIYDSFMPLQITHEENGQSTIIPTCQLEPYLKGQPLPKEPGKVEGPKVTVVYKDDLSDLRPPKK